MISRHPGRSAVTALVMTLSLLLLSSTPASASGTCSSSTYYEPAQTSLASYQGVVGDLTDPSAAQLAGSLSNDNDGQHQLLWFEMLNENPEGSCGADQTECWQQVGVGMGTVEWSGSDFSCSSYASDQGSTYNVYYEGIGPGADDCYDYSYTGISINEDSAIPFDLFYDGGVGGSGYPQFDGEVTDSSGTLRHVNYGQLYYSTDHVKVASEEWTGSTSTCVTATNGSPYQNFGTDDGGNWSSGNYKMQLEDSSGSWGAWTGSPNTNNANPYWYDPLANSPADFQTNGPSPSGL
jgi:hypothetical protein